MFALFFLVSIETTVDWYRIAPLYIAYMSHELSENLILRYTLSESSICHRRCQKIGKFELEGSYSSNKINSQVCQREAAEMMCSSNRKQKK